MNARALPWFEDEEPRDLLRWSIAAAVVVCIHAALIAAYLNFWHAPDEEIGDETPIISIDLTAPQIDQVEQQKVDKPVPPKETVPNAVIPVPKPPPKVERTNPAPRTTVHEVASAPRIDPSWESLLLKHLQEFKNYPLEARRRNEQGVVLLAFSIDRNGHVVSRHIVQRLRLCRSRRRGAGPGRARTADAGVPAEHDRSAARSDRADPLFAALNSF